MEVEIYDENYLIEPHCFLCDKPHSKSRYLIKSTPPYNFFLCEDCVVKMINQFPVKNPEELELQKLYEMGEKFTKKY